MSFEEDYAPYNDGDSYDEMDVRFGWDLRNHEVHCLAMALRKSEAERDALKADNEQLKRDNHDLNVALGSEGYGDADFSDEDDRAAAHQAHAEAMAVCADFKAKFDDLKARADAYDALKARIDGGIRAMQWPMVNDKGEIALRQCLITDDFRSNATLILDDDLSA